MSGGNGAERNAGGGDGVPGGEVALWLPSRRLSRSLMAIAVGGRSTLHEFDARRSSATLPINFNFGHLGWATRSERQSFANLSLSQAQASVYQTALRLPEGCRAEETQPAATAELYNAIRPHRRDARVPEGHLPLLRDGYVSLPAALCEGQAVMYAAHVKTFKGDACASVHIKL